MQEIYKFEQRGVDERGAVLGQLSPTGIRAHALKRIESFGVDAATVLDAHLKG
jgi:pilus assembly protein CpaF